MNRWGLALRVARREAWRNKKRSALVVAMLALPVAGATAADTLWRSSQITAEQKATWQMGRYDALVTDVGNPMYQTPDLSDSGPVDQGHDPNNPGSGGPGSGSENSGSQNNNDPKPLRTAPISPAGLTALLPPGSRVAHPEQLYSGQVQVVDGDGRAWGQVETTDLSDPMLAVTVTRHAGTAPTTTDEVALSSALAGELHKGVGDTIAVRTMGGDTPPPPKNVRITGIYDTKLDPYDYKVFALPEVFASQQVQGQTAFPVAVPGGVDWTLTQKLNAQGFTVLSKQLLADPPPRSEVPYYQHYPVYSSDTDKAKLAVVAIALSIVVLEVVLLAGPAFAVSARRRRRDFGLLGAAGADGRRLRRIVLADGVVLGAAGGVIGAVAGIVVSAATLPWFGHFSQQALGGFRLKPLELLAAAALGVGTGLTAAVAPAISTSRQDVLAALTGRRGQSSVPWKMPAAGLVGVVLGSGLILVGAWSNGNAYLVAGGVVLAELGLVACTPVLVAFSGKLARALPLTGRLALRDSARNRGRTAPAVAAIMAAVAGASTVAMVVNSDDAQQRHYYTSQLRSGQASAMLSDYGSGMPLDAANRLTNQIERVLPTQRSAILQGVTYQTESDQDSVTPMVVRAPGNDCPDSMGIKAAARDQRCVSNPGGRIQFMTGASKVVAGGPELVRVLLGHSDQAAEDVLKAGGAVVFNDYDLATTGAKPTAEFGIAGTCDNQQVKCPNIIKKVTLPAVSVHSPRWDVDAVVPPAALDGLGAKFAPMAVLFDTTHMPSGQQEKEADNLVAAAGVQEQFYVERGYQSQTWAGLLALAAVAGVVMLGAAAVATGLAITDAQADLETLAAVGARPRLRRALAGSQAAVTAGMGAVLGAAFGLLPAVGLIEAKARQIDPNSVLTAQHTQFAPPWLYLGMVVVALPVLAATGAAGFTRSRIELRRRRG